VPSDLLCSFDKAVAKRGLSQNRSEAVRDLIRDFLVEEGQKNPNQKIVATLTIVYDHHASDVKAKLDNISHEHFDVIVSSMHIHLDHHNCLEVIVMRGKTSTINEISDVICGLKGVNHGQLSSTAAL
jgi:CopG family nickel-responsive transcriptional regulator